MSWLELNPGGVPAAVRVLPFVLWSAKPSSDGGKPRKVPRQIAAPDRNASSTDAATWGTFDDACEAYFAITNDARCARLRIAGVGGVLLQERETSCIDLDHVIDDRGVLDPRAQTIITRAKSWAEISPSGTGIHIFVHGALPAALKGTQIEIYSTARYIAVTGHTWPGAPAEVRGAQAYLDSLYALAHPHEGQPRRQYTGPVTPPPDDLAGALLAKLQTWGVDVARVKRWEDGYLVELPSCPWAMEHTSGPTGAVVMIRASGAFDFMCQHAHCSGRRWRDFRALMGAGR